MQKGTEEIKMLYIAGNTFHKYDILQCSALLPYLFFCTEKRDKRDRVDVCVMTVHREV